MISRYSRPEMVAVWSDERRYATWLKIELLALEKMSEDGLVTKEELKTAQKLASFDPERIAELEKEVKHDVIAFLTNVAEHVGAPSRYIHRGLTSSDVLDTALACQLKESGEMLLQGIDRLLAATKKRAEEFKHTPCVGRSHGIHAEPTTLGLKLASWYAEIKRARQRLSSAIDDVSVGKISGAVGTYASTSPELEHYVMQNLGLRAETVSSQIVHRDRHAHFFSALALLGSSIEKFSVEIRHLQRTEVRELEEKFDSGQKGSSAMPHKRNPILTENLSGLARLLRGYSLSAMENIALWHERDISHSSVERVIAPDACILVDFMLARFTSVVEGMKVYPDRMMENLELTRGLVFSGTLLIALVDKGVSREDAYRLVQNHALAAWEGGATFPERVKSDSEIKKHLSTDEILAIFDLKRHLNHVDIIFDRVFS